MRHPEKIISGGQTGADQGGLEAGKELGLQTGGFAPYNWMTETGPQEELLKSYGLEPAPYDPKTFPKRTELNVIVSNGTVWFGTTSSPGYACTKKAKDKRELRYWIENPDSLQLRKWLEDRHIVILNVAGNRESKNPGLQKEVKELIIRALSKEAEE